jgi:hypothetical protein
MSDNEDQISAIAYGRVVGAPENDSHDTIQASRGGGEHTTVQESKDVRVPSKSED